MKVLACMTLAGQNRGSSLICNPLMKFERRNEQEQGSSPSGSTGSLLCLSSVIISDVVASGHSWLMFPFSEMFATTSNHEFRAFFCLEILQRSVCGWLDRRHILGNTEASAVASHKACRG